MNHRLFLSHPRSKFELVASILEALSSSESVQASAGGLRSTRLMYASNLSSKQMKRYLRFLEEHELVTVILVGVGDGSKHARVYQVTDDGRAYLVAYKQLQQTLSRSRNGNDAASSRAHVDESAFPLPPA